MSDAIKRLKYKLFTKIGIFSENYADLNQTAKFTAYTGKASTNAQERL